MECLAPPLWPRLLLCQFENLAFSLTLALPLLWLGRARRARRAYVLLVGVVLVYLAVNQVFYRIFSDHFQVGLIEGQEGGIGTFKDSILFELKPLFFAHLAAACAITVYLFRRVGHPQTENLSPRAKRVAFLVATAIVAYGGASWFFGRAQKIANLNYHPVVSLARSILVPLRHDAAPVKLIEDLETLRFGQVTAPSIPPETWLPEQSQWRVAARKPNVVLIVLESVGSEQILTNGRTSPERTPELARRSARMTTFPYLYNTFPGTVRSHTPLATGGRTITWGSVFEELSFPYQGPTIVSELKLAGYSSAVFSAAYMETENLGGFYDQLPFDLKDYPDRWTKAERDQFQLNSWGVDEREVMRRAAAWAKDARAPFFLQVLTSATHHPYSAPKDFPAPRPRNDDRKDRYANALAFLDAAIGQLLNALAAEGHDANTLVFIVGDHGQAFADLHPQNLTHKNHIYEENIRNFLIVLNPATQAGARSIPRIGTLGDVAPTIVGFATAAPKDFAAQNLYDPGYEERLVFFHKNAFPERWGLRDGRWKFAVDKVGGGNAELYDLETDPTEQSNLAAHHPEKLVQYGALVASWYIKTNDQYVARLRNFRKAGGIRLNPEEVQSYGPKRLVFGSRGKDGKFKELPAIHPEEEMLAWTYGVPFPTNQKVDYEWTSPSGKVRRFNFEFDKDWSQTEVFHSPREPMEQGIWTLALSANGKPLVTGSFTVKASAELLIKRKFP